MEEEKPFLTSNISEEQLNALYNHFIKIRSGLLPHTRKASHSHPPKRTPKKPVREDAENFMVHIDDYFKKHR